MDPEILAVNAHSELCVNQAYCLNGGTCYRLMALGRLYCDCADSFEGERCNLKKVGIADLDMSRTYENILSSWNGLLPVAIVVTVAIILMVALFCIYVCAKKCYQKYSITSPVKILRYQNASAQTSISQIYLLSGDNQCNGRPASLAITASRTRLIACSTTPENAENIPQDLNHSRRSSLDLESGSCIEADLFERGHASTHPCIVLTEPEAIEARRNYQRGGTDHGIIAAESTPNRSKRANDCGQGASAPSCLSPNDSNNNRDISAWDSSRRAIDPVRASSEERTTLLFQPEDCIHNKCVGDSDWASSKALNSEPSDLYDSDPEATAL